MRSPLLAAAALAALILLAACGGGGGDDNPADTVDSRAVPTATLPAELPPVLLVGTAGLVPPVGRDGAIGGGETHEVESGETPSGIAAQYGITVDELFAANGLEAGAVLSVGQRLVIPVSQTIEASPTEVSGPSNGGATGGDTTVDETPTPSAGGGSGTYTVVAGDIASDIAARFGISVEELAQANDMTVDEISSLIVGQVLTIP